MGIELFDQEICFCAGEILRHSPRVSPPHIYRQSVDLGESSLKRPEIFAVIHRLETEFPAYDLLSNNCIHFAASLAREIGIKPLPRSFFLLTDSLSLLGAALRRPTRRTSSVTLRPLFASKEAYKKPAKFELSLVLDRRHTLTYLLPEGEFVVGEAIDKEANFIAIPKGYIAGFVKLNIGETILLSTPTVSTPLLVNRPFLLQTLICTLRPMQSTLTS